MVHHCGDRLLVMGRWAGEGGRVKVGHVANLYAMGSRLWEDPYPSLPQVSRYRRGRLLGKGGFANCYILREVGFLLECRETTALALAVYKALARP